MFIKNPTVPDAIKKEFMANEGRRKRFGLETARNP